MDALQAYICAVQIDSQHGAAWTNLGMLHVLPLLFTFSYPVECFVRFPWPEVFETVKVYNMGSMTVCLCLKIGNTHSVFGICFVLQHLVIIV